MRKIINVETGEVTEDPDFVPEPPNPIPPPPVTSVTARQARLWLLRAGVTDAAVRAAIESTLPPDKAAEALIEWEYATEFEKDHPLVKSLLGNILNLSEDGIQAAFEEAAKL